MTIALVDNGSLEPAAHRQLRVVAAALGARTGTTVHPVSWKHSDRITPGELGGQPAWTLVRWVRAQRTQGETEFVFVPFFISAQGAIGSSLRADLERLQADAGPFSFSFTDGLGARGALPRIVADRIRTCIGAHGFARPAVIVVDHGGPSAQSARVRDEVAADVRTQLGDTIRDLAAASMEGEEHAHNQPLLADQLAAPGFASGDVVIAPLFLLPGRHAGQGGDLAQIAEAAAGRPRFTGLVGDHPWAVDTLASALQDHLFHLHAQPSRMSTSTDATPAPKPLHKNEQLKAGSNFLRGDILRDLADTSTGTITEDSAQLTKFHGIYAQDDRDQRNQRRKEGREKAFIFMARVRVPGGVCTPAQWLALDALADSHANGTLKLTTRQAFQFHGILKGNLRATIKGVNQTLLDTIAACGDVNRNVMCNPNPEQSSLHAAVQRVAEGISAHLLPRTRAYHELWVDDELVGGGEPEEEPIYGRTYLPRKFKIAVAVPPSNDVDVFSNDLGYIAITDEAGGLAGFNVTVGGGLGMSHNQLETYPRLADVLGFCRPDQAVDVAEKVVLVQRDFGDRTDRKHARLKYTIADRGIAWFRAEVERRLGYALGAARPYRFTHNSDRYGWVDGGEGRSHFTLFLQSGRVKDTPGYSLKTGLRELARIHQGDFRLTANQNLIVANVTATERPRIEAILRAHRLDTANDASGLKLNAMSCVALPTCGLALAESERYLPELVTSLEQEIEAAGLRHDAITLRITGCPNGCGRPFLGEIGLVGRAPGKYNVYLGAAADGTRLNTLHRASVPVAELVPLLGPIFRQYARERTAGESFGDFVIRAGHVKPTHTPQDFHEQKAAGAA